MKWKAEDRGLVNAMEPSWHRADMDRDLTHTMVKRQNPNKASLATSQTPAYKRRVATIKS
jgi:hypothetical protein